MAVDPVGEAARQVWAGEMSLLDIPEDIFVETIGKHEVATFASTEDLLKYLETGRLVGFNLGVDETGTLPDGLTVHGAGVRSAMRALSVRQENSDSTIPLESGIIEEYVLSSHYPSMSTWGLKILLYDDIKTGGQRGQEILERYSLSLPFDENRKIRVCQLAETLNTFKNEATIYKKIVEEVILPVYEISPLEEQQRIAWAMQKQPWRFVCEDSKKVMLAALPKLKTFDNDISWVSFLFDVASMPNSHELVSDERLHKALEIIEDEDGRVDIMEEVIHQAVRSLLEHPENKMQQGGIDWISQNCNTFGVLALTSRGLFPSPSIMERFLDQVVENPDGLADEEDLTVTDGLVNILKNKAVLVSKKEEILRSLAAVSFFTKYDSLGAFLDEELQESFNKLTELVRQTFSLPDSLPLSYAERVICL